MPTPTAFAAGGECLMDDLKQNPVSEAVADAASSTKQQFDKLVGSQEKTAATAGEDGA